MGATSPDKIQDEDPEAYEYLTGERSETRVGYAVLSAVGTFLALPFLLRVGAAAARAAS